MIAFFRQFKAKLGTLWWYSAVNFAFSRISDLINIYIGAFLVPAAVSPDALGAVVPLTTLYGFMFMPMTILLNVTLKYMNSFKVDGKDGMVKALFRDMLVIALVLSVIMAAGLWLSRGFIVPRLRVSESGVLWMLICVCVSASVLPVFNTTAQAMMRFRSFILSAVLGSVVRLVVLILLLKPFQLTGYLSGFMVYNLAIIAFLGWSIRDIMRSKARPESYRRHWPNMWRYSWKAGIPSLVLSAAAILEPFVIRNFTPNMDSAGYYIACIFGQVPFYLSLAITPFLFPIVSEDFERGRHTGGMLLQTMTVILLGGGVASLAFAAGGGYLLRLRGDWAPYAGYAGLLWKVAVMNTLQSAVFAYVTHENACNRFRYARFLLPVMIAEMVLLYVFMGWGFFKPYLSPDAWEMVESFLTPRLDFAVGFMIATRFLLSGFAFWSAWRGRLQPGAPFEPGDAKYSFAAGSAKS